MRAREFFALVENYRNRRNENGGAARLEALAGQITCRTLIVLVVISPKLKTKLQYLDEYFMALTDLPLGG